MIKTVHFKALLSSVTDLIIYIIGVIIFAYLSDFVTELLYAIYERDEFNMPNKQGNYHSVTSFWIDYESVILSFTYFTSLVLLNKVTTGYWFSQSIGKKLFKLKLTTNWKNKAASLIALVVRYALSFPLLYMLLFASNLLDKFEVWVVILPIALVYFIDYGTLWLSQDKKMRDLLCGSRIEQLCR